MEAFFGEDDYRAYLEMLTEWLGRGGNRLWAYCLMPNHVHLIVVPETPDGLSRAIGEVHRRYTRRINFRERWRGHLWQGRFASFVMDESHVIAAARYVESNPVKAGLVERAEQWPWSSAAAHVGTVDDGIVETAWLTERTAGWVCSWGEYLCTPDGAAVTEAMRRHENTGRPLGDYNFIRRVGTLLGRDIIPKKGGRPKKDKN